MTRLCDWNPEEDAPVNPHGHGVSSSAWRRDGAGCPNPATLVLGSRGEWYLCDSCADLPRFSRFKVRVTVREFFRRRKHSAGKRVIPEYPFADERRRRKRDGRADWKICMWCGEQVTGRRRNWCSDACVDEWRIRREPAFARSMVRRRDRGVCSACGKDTEAIERFFDDNRCAYPDGEWRRMYTEALGVPPGRRCNGCWDMDHITPVVEGGGGCGLAGLRTLCIPCHRGATAELAARRAAERRPQRELPLEETG